MPDQKEYMRGYNRAQNTASRKREDLRQKYAAAFDRMRNVAERGMGRCDRCRFWVRQSAAAQWGFCDMQRAQEHTHPTWPAPWAHINCIQSACRARQNLTTSAAFGCINFDLTPGMEIPK